MYFLTFLATSSSKGLPASRNASKPSERERERKLGGEGKDKVVRLDEMWCRREEWYIVQRGGRKCGEILDWDAKVF